MIDGDNTNSREANAGDKNWKEMREKNEHLEQRNAELEAKVRLQPFKDAGLNVESCVGKAVEKLYEDEDLTVEAIQGYASAEFGVEFGQQDGIQSEVKEVEESQARLDNVQKSSVVDSFTQDDLVDAINKATAEGDIKTSMKLKLAAMEEAKENS